MRRALAELRHHPSRFFAVILAIAVAIGFIVAAETAIETEFSGMANSQVAQAAKADLVVTSKRWFEMSDSERKAQGDYKTPAAGTYEKALAAVPNVTAEPMLSTMMVLGAGDKTIMVRALPVAKNPKIQWFKLLDGQLPKAKNEIVLGQSALDKLGVKLGDTIQPNAAMSAGLEPVKVVGVTDIPQARLLDTLAGVSNAQFEDQRASLPPGHERHQTDWVIAVSSGSVATAKADIEKSLAANGIKFMSVSTKDELTTTILKEVTVDGINPMSVMVGLFGAISLLVGTIIIATTFSILFTGRRRQIALLRLVGATGGQVRAQLFAEAIAIGLIGSVAGLGLGLLCAWGATWWTGSLYWGLIIPWLWAAGALLVGVLVTVIAAFVPAVRATRVPPISALIAVPTAERARRMSILRALTCLLFLIAGGVLAWLSLTYVQPKGTGGPPDETPFLYAVASAFCLSIGILWATPIFVPWLLRFFGWLLTPFGPTGRMAALNAVRNPGRSAATATALMLAIGLIITLQVGAATSREFALDQIAKKYPIDVSVIKADDSLPSELVTKIRQTPGITSTVTPPTATLTAVNWSLKKEFERPVAPGEERPPLKETDLIFKVTAIKSIPQISDVLRQPWTDPPVGVALVSRWAFVDQDAKPDGHGGAPLRKTEEFTTASGAKVTLKLQESPMVNDYSIILNPADFDKLGGEPTTQVLWGQVKDRSQVLSVYGKLDSIMGLRTQHMGPDGPNISVGGGLAAAAMMEETVNTIMLIVSGLLGVSVLIALIGMGNTLGLSVLERTRESALLRALGTQRRSLRLMLAIEALLMALTGVLVGALAGGFFAWMGSKAVLSLTEDDGNLSIAVDWKITGTAVGLTILAGLISSILPGRRAAKATPTAALADIG